MPKINLEKAATAGDVLFRYMQAPSHFKERVERPLPAHELAMLISNGKREFDEIYVEPEANPPIVLDGKADDFFGALIKKNYSALPGCDPQVLSASRLYVLRDTAIPRLPVPRTTPANATKRGW
jgi:hypothetical protein